MSSSSLISPTKLWSELSYTDSSSEAAAPLVIAVLSSLIERTVSRNERILSGCRSSSAATAAPITDHRDVFDCSETPDMTVQSYLERIFRYTRAGPSVYVVAYVYIDRFCQANPGFRITSRNVHRLLITTIMVASKYVEDMNYRNSYFARVGGVKTEEINRLEVELLFMMGFRMHVNVSVFQSYCCHLEREVSYGGGFQIERALRCAAEIKACKQRQHHTTLITRSNHIINNNVARIML